MLYLRACPRCRMGAVRLSADTHGPFLSCLNCGFIKSGNAWRNFDEQRAPMLSGSARQTPPQPGLALANS